MVHFCSGAAVHSCSALDIYLITTNGETGSQQARNVIKAGSGPGDAHIVRQSGYGTSECRMIAQHEDIEKELRDSQLRYTIVKPTFFMQNLLMSAQTVASDGAMYWPLGDGRIGMVDVRDVADVAFKVLTSEGHEGKTYVLTGPAAISLGGAAAGLSNALNKEVAYVDVPSQALRDSLGEMGMPEWTVEAYAELMEGFKEGYADMTTPSVEQLTGHPARSFEAFARDFAGAFGAN